MDYVIEGSKVQSTIEDALDDIMADAKPDDQVTLSYTAAESLLYEIDSLRSGPQSKVRLLHVMTAETEQLIRIEAISCVAVQKNGMATIAFAGGGVIQFDALAWRILFAHIKEYADLETIPIAPPSKLVSQA